MPDSFDRAEFERRLREQLKTSREAFDGQYKSELTQLACLSKEDIDAITPGTTDLQKYDELVALVKEASRVNLAQAELKQRIEALGNVAVSVAKLVPTLAAIL
ncbi:MAG TPA: hypothetical protein VHA82_02200 [Ramlibacter sp.]|uniref:hypothetical protein n=1 Tax=Ramlibacter sp. TaxID=1917967 RepID=UPI002CC7A785|nr:hypothetical protein [Ramlibacter sp.]HVZ42593.1 hypothetical protein [Ramlibacter sp.]